MKGRGSAAGIPQATADDPAAPVAPVVQPSLTLPHTTPLHEALAEVRRASRQRANVTREGRFVGVVTLADVLRGVLPRSA